MRKHYWLPRHVFACETLHGAVFLDLKRDKYFGVPQSACATLANIVANWPSRPSGRAAAGLTHGGEEAKIATELLHDGLLTEEPTSGASDSQRCHGHVDGFAEVTDAAFETRVSALDIAKFVVACVRAKWTLRNRPLESIVNAVTARRLKHSGSDFDFRHAADLISRFRKLRIYAFTAEDRCLFHALALTHFLALHGIYARWIIGVRTNPWGAHSWVQHEHFVLDGTPEQILPYQPILSA